MIELNANLEGMKGYLGAVGGILEAVESPRFQGKFSNYVLTRLKAEFMVDTIAAKEAGTARLSHVFEWGPQDESGVAEGESTGNIPLFRLKIGGGKAMKILTYDFLPSTQPVPLPDPARYGFDEKKLSFMRRHTFVQKALVMETMSAVEIAPRGDNRLFIPDATNPRGYYMTNKPKTINPGGEQATGGFAEWWILWFNSSAQIHVKKAAALAEQTIAKTGQKVIRDAAGRFAKGATVSMGYVDAAKRNAYLEMQAAERVFDVDDYEDE